jgi:hypothetical protein
MRYHLRTLLIVLALGPPVLSWLVGPALLRILYGPPSKLEFTLRSSASFTDQSRMTVPEWDAAMEPDGMDSAVWSPESRPGQSATAPKRP